MSRTLPALRRDLDVMPSPVPDRPGLLIRDPLGYAENILIVPPALAPALECFDGSRTELDLRARLVQLTGQLEVGELLAHLLDAVEQGGFVEGSAFESRRAERQRAFAMAPERLAAHAGSAYPKEAEALSRTLEGWLVPNQAGERGESDAGRLLGVAAPHVSPEGGVACYAEAFRHLAPLAAQADPTLFVVLGTSHYGAPERFGLTRKPFRTPLGATRPVPDLVARLEADGGTGVSVEDYCHAVEHSIEFQVMFLQQLFGAEVAVLPILCGPFARHTLGPGLPEQDDGVARFFDALRDLASRETRRLVWVLGIDMAHVGRRYGDAFTARANEGPLERVAARDAARLEHVVAGDAEGFWSAIQEDADPLRWCGAAPLYAFLRVAEPGAAHLRRYEQWNIDEASVVSFAAIRFES